jgi:hypothetical protein|tara:strand:- start:238 stop:471 length:234 start_codon:yes stop_codon:yes gene_type:complete
MATQNKFVIEYGLSVGSTEVISSAGKVVAAALTTIDTDDITEGSSNLYYADSKVQTLLADSGTAKTLANVGIDGGTI